MDDYSITNLYESRNEFTARLVNILTPHVIEGVRSIFDEAWKLCADNDEESKYLMTFLANQNFVSHIQFPIVYKGNKANKVNNLKKTTKRQRAIVIAMNEKERVSHTVGAIQKEPLRHD